MEHKLIAGDIKEVLALHDVAHTDKGVDGLITKWEEEKETLIDLLRKHPNWSERHIAEAYTTYSTMCQLPIRVETPTDSGVAYRIQAIGIFTIIYHLNNWKGEYILLVISNKSIREQVNIWVNISEWATKKGVLSV